MSADLGGLDGRYDLPLPDRRRSTRPGSQLRRRSDVHDPLCRRGHDRWRDRDHRTEATLHGSLEPSGIDAHYYFEWGTDTGYGHKTPAPPGTDAGSGLGVASASATIGGLDHSTTYHYRLVAENADGTDFGADQTFRTLEAVIGLENDRRNRPQPDRRNADRQTRPRRARHELLLRMGPDLELREQHEPAARHVSRLDRRNRKPLGPD